MNTKHVRYCSEILVGVLTVFLLACNRIPSQNGIVKIMTVTDDTGDSLVTTVVDLKTDSVYKQTIKKPKRYYKIGGVYE